MHLAGPPARDVPVPDAVSRLAAGRPVRPVWENQLGGLTFEVGSGSTGCFVKWAPRGSGIDLAGEAERLRWARPHTPVPEVLDIGDDADGGSWLALASLPGRSAVDPRWVADPASAVRAIGHGLRRLHDAAPVRECPFDWSIDARVASAPEAEQGRLAAAPDVDRLVVCHGDACAPNTLLLDDGTWSGHVDLGALGVADRWADLAVATWSTEWNFGPGWERPLLDAYGVAPDPERTAFYRLLWQLT